MSTLSNILEQGRRAVQVQQLVMQVIGHNTTNAGTVGYSRRQVDLGTSPPGATGLWGVGAGVDINDLSRVRDRLLDNQIRSGVSLSSYWNVREHVLGQVEDTFNAMGSNNLATLLDNFWQGWQDLANDPESMSPRYQMRDRATALVNGVRRVYDGLNSQIEETNTRIAAAAESVNDLTSGISELNVQIVANELGGHEASDLRDSRDLLVEQLSGIMDISVQEQPDGSLNIYSRGSILVQGDLSVPVTINEVDGDSKKHVVLRLGSSHGSWRPDGGELGALFNHRDQVLPGLIAKLDTFAQEFSSSVNALHMQGYGLNGGPGNEFFDVDVDGVRNFAVSEIISADVALIAASSAAESPGDNSLALRIAALQHQNSTQGISLDQFLRNVPLEVGSSRAASIQQRDIENAVLENATNRRSAISGVSLDEEMAKLLETQKAYEAAAKIIQTVDEMMQTVLDMKS